MWKEMKIDGVVKIEKCAGEFFMSSPAILPGSFIKIKVFESQNNLFKGICEVKVKRKDGNFHLVSEQGNSVDEALDNTIKKFLAIYNEDYPEKDYPDGIGEDDFEYLDYYEL